MAGRCEQIADIDVAEFEAVITEAKEKVKGVLKQGTKLPRSSSATTATLKEMGLNKDQSSKYQQLFDVPENEVTMKTLRSCARGVLEAYLRSKNLQRPMLGAQRRVEARIGQLLGEGKRGRPSNNSLMSEIKEIDKDDRARFRILARGFDCHHKTLLRLP